MRIAAFTDEINRENLTRAVQLAALWDVEAVEIRRLSGGRFPSVSDAELKDVGRIVAGAGRILSGVSPGLFKCSVDDDIEAGIAELLPRACDWARNWGTQRVSTFAFHRGDEPHDSGRFPTKVVDTLGRMCDVAAASGCQLVLENEAVCWGDTGTEAAMLIRAVGSDRLSLCWDPGNAARAGALAAEQEYEGLADLVTHVHLKNFDPSVDDWSLMEGGSVDWPAQFRALADDGYTGYLVIETHTSAAPAMAAAPGSAGEPLSPLEANSLRNLQYLRALLS
jgi:sugar phosphate isomerase/epimerase